MILNHGTVGHRDLFLKLPAIGHKALNLSSTSSGRMFLGLSLFNSAGVCFMAYAIYSSTTIVLAPSYPVTAEMANDANVHGKVDGSFLTPKILNNIVQRQEYLHGIKRLKYLNFGGAALSREVGDKLKYLTHLFVSFGLTETGFYALEVTEAEDWEYVSFSPVMGCELRPFANGLHELYFVCQNQLKDIQGIFSTYPGLTEYCSRDLYSKHPSKEGLWLYEGRSDDVLVGSHGYNFSPRAMEVALQAHPLVRGALVCGENRERTSLLIEARSPPKADAERSELLLKIWPSVERANAHFPPYAKVLKDLVLFTDVDKPMIRSTKGTVSRKRTVELYGESLEKLYNAFTCVRL